jgi:hypothetical protein
MAWAKECTNIIRLGGCGRFQSGVRFLPTHLLGSLPQPHLSKEFFRVKINLILDNEVRSSGQFMS